MQPVSIKSCLKRTLKSLDLYEAYSQQKVMALWNRICGNEIAQVTRAESLKGGTLTVAALDHIWASELGSFSYQYMEKYRRLMKREVVKSIRFVPRPRLFQKGGRKEPEPYDPRSLSLSPGELKKVQEVSLKVDDEKARALVESMLAEKLKYEQWMKKRGGRPCFGCGVMVEKGASFCFFCAREMEENSRAALREALRETPYVTFKEVSRGIVPLTMETYREVKDRMAGELYAQIVDGMEKAGPGDASRVKGQIITLAMLKTGKKSAELKDDVLREAVSPYMYKFYKG